MRIYADRLVAGLRDKEKRVMARNRPMVIWPAKLLYISSMEQAILTNRFID